MKRYFLTLLVAIVSMATNAQQWEIDLEGIGNYSPLRTGIINNKGEAVIMGECGTDDDHYYPMIMRDRKSTRLNSSHNVASRMPSSA